MTTPLYSLVWRNKFLTTEATSIDDMIVALQQATDQLKEMKAAGVTLDMNGGVEDDYATLVTDNPDVAQKFGFTDDDAEDDDEENLDDWVDDEEDDDEALASD